MREVVAETLAKKRTHWGGTGYNLCSQDELSDAVDWVCNLIADINSEARTHGYAINLFSLYQTFPWEG